MKKKVQVKFSKLKKNTAFRHRNSLFLKDDSDECAVNLKTGHVKAFGFGNDVSVTLTKVKIVEVK